MTGDANDEPFRYRKSSESSPSLHATYGEDMMYLRSAAAYIESSSSDSTFMKRMTDKGMIQIRLSDIPPSSCTIKGQ